MGEIVDFHQARKERQAEKDRSSSKPYHPRKTVPLLDPEWDEEAGKHVPTLHVPDWSRPIQGDPGDEI